MPPQPHCKAVDVGAVISDAIHGCTRKPTGRLYFPTLIHGLMKKAKVPVPPGEAFTTNALSIECKTVDRIRKTLRNDPGQPPLAPDSSPMETDLMHEVRRLKEKVTELETTLERSAQAHHTTMKRALKAHEETLLKKMEERDTRLMTELKDMPAGISRRPDDH
ncbi:uncharacterized protein LOC112504584 [Cynara cardunculus var. scolymus]|uniref:uncharacterized protein LOC112504584 n=1 Tax=Cynara cardunculus var. scolymus TaxID=59895 RepID=UPI000D629287|nr:uncharacterized protein LOC112504584 [Cynara cardunculus var. scolymus]